MGGRRGRLTAALLGSAVVLAGTGAAPAAAAPSGCGLSCAGEDGGGWGAGTSSVTITVTGGPGGPGSSTTSTVPGPPPVCWWFPLNDEATVLAADHPAAADNPAAVGHPGRYWGVHVTDDLGDDPLDRDPADQAVADACIAAGGGGLQWFADDIQQPPAPPALSIDVLLDIAETYLEPPEPVVDRNPAATAYVNLPTWVWTDAASRTPMTVRAQSGPNWVEIAAEPDGLSVSAPYATQSGSCASGGTPWAAGATTDCTIVFGRSSVRGPWPMEVAVTWSASWTSTTSGPQPLAPRTAATVVDVPVAEVQSVVRR